MTTRPVRPLHLLRRSTAAVAAALVVGTVAAGLAAAEESPDELREERRQVQAEAAEVAEDVDALTDDVTELTGALEALRASVDAEQAALDAAERRVADAEADEAAARQAIVDLEDEMATTQDLLRDASVRAFVGFQGPTTDEIVFSDNPWEHARTEALVAFGTGNTADLIDELRALGSELEGKEREAEATTARLEDERAAVEQRKLALDEAVAREESVLAEVDARLEARLAEAAALEALDADLAGRIEAEERRIAEAIRERERRAAQNRGGSSGSIPAGAPVSLATVRGIVVNAAVAGQVEGLLGAMEARGFPLGGGGYRGSERQVELRRAHCGGSDYAIWEMPASQCRPPTARPGLSQHEQGLAIDFTYQGQIISSRGSAVFQALAEVAPQYGFHNLPSEPWHWSTTGG